MEKTNSSTPYIDNIVRSYTQGAQKFYPDLKFQKRRSLYNGDQPYTCELEFRLTSSNLNNTEYQVKRNADLIHYSSNASNIIEIVNGGIFRLSNLNALNDPQEVSFMTKNLHMEFRPDHIRSYKDNYFTASFCKIVNKNEPDTFPMWRLYGGDGYGAAITFEVINFRAEWHDFLLAHVQYGHNKAVERYKQFINFHNEFQSGNNYPLTNFPKAFSSLLALHKNEIWGSEKEIRLLTHQEFDEYTLNKKSHHLCALKHSITSTGKRYTYVELPLFNSVEYQRLCKLCTEPMLKSFIPVLKIKSIILGYKHHFNTVMEVQNITQLLTDQYKYNIPVYLSRLANQMI